MNMFQILVPPAAAKLPMKPSISKPDIALQQNQSPDSEARLWGAAENQTELALNRAIDGKGEDLGPVQAARAPGERRQSHKGMRPTGPADMMQLHCSRRSGEPREQEKSGARRAEVARGADKKRPSAERWPSGRPLKRSKA
jgi:hypothetical protein